MGFKIMALPSLLQIGPRGIINVIAKKEKKIASITPQTQCPQYP
jgi:hypothetical protein